MPTPCPSSLRSNPFSLKNILFGSVALLVSVVAIGKFLSFGNLPPSQLQISLLTSISNKLNESEIGTTVDLANLTPFAWQKVCGFGGISTVTTINQTLGYAWLHQVPTWMPMMARNQRLIDENSTLLVFLNNQQVVASVNLPGRLVTVGDEPCFQANEAQLDTGETEVGNGQKTFYLDQKLKPGDLPRSM